jgi:hypothetical protein
MNRIPDVVAKTTITLGLLGLFPALFTTAMLGLAVRGELTGTEVLWLLGAIAPFPVLIAGVTLRLTERRPALSAILLLVGAPAPSLAIPWLPSLYLLSPAIAVFALASVSTANHMAAAI